MQYGAGRDDDKNKRSDGHNKIVLSNQISLCSIFYQWT
jgi:hypothetical protein